MDDDQEQKNLEFTKANNASEVFNVETRRNDVSRKKSEKLKKEDEYEEDELTSIGKSTCGRWIKFRQKLGEGSYKGVFKGYDSEKGCNVAWCEFKFKHLDSKEKQIIVLKEIEIMVKMDHPNIVTCYDVFDEYIDLRNVSNPVNVKSLVLIQELMDEGTLKCVIKKNFINGKLILKLSLVMYWLHQILDALTYMHEKLNPPIIHRDLKAENCFLESKSSDKCLNVKVGDFGLAKPLDEKENNTMLGTVGFMAPEIYDEKYNVKVDIYAFGMMMLEVLTNRSPYDECETVMQVAKKTMSGKFPNIFSLVTDQRYKEVIKCCIHPLPIYRPTSQELYYHPIFVHYYDSDSINILPVEIIPNFEKNIDRETRIHNFVANILTDDGKYNTKFNLRMEFQNAQMQSSFGLDKGESLEFDLDVYKDGDIPELIYNLRSEYQENMREALNPNKINDPKAISIHLDRIFKSMEMQLNFLLKVIHGNRWYYILDNILSKETDLDDKDTITGFSLLAKYKKNWMLASTQLDNEICNYAKIGNVGEIKKINKVNKIGSSLPNEPGKEIKKDSFKSESKANIDKKLTTNEVFDSAPLLCGGPQSMQKTSCSVTSVPYIPPLFWPTTFLTNKVATNPSLAHGKVENVVDMTSVVQVSNESLFNDSDATSSSAPVEQLDNRDDNKSIEQVFTYDDVMKYVSTKSSKKSKQPFMIIPIKDQTNAFKILTMQEPQPLRTRSKDKMSCGGKSAGSSSNREKIVRPYNSYLFNQPTTNLQQPYVNPYLDPNGYQQFGINGEFLPMTMQCCYNPLSFSPPIYGPNINNMYPGVLPVRQAMPLQSNISDTSSFGQSGFQLFNLQLLQQQQLQQQQQQQQQQHPLPQQQQQHQHQHQQPQQQQHQPIQHVHSNPLYQQQQQQQQAYQQMQLQQQYMQQQYLQQMMFQQNQLLQYQQQQPSQGKENSKRKLHKKKPDTNPFKSDGIEQHEGHKEVPDKPKFTVQTVENKNPVSTKKTDVDENSKQNHCNNKDDENVCHERNTDNCMDKNVYENQIKIVNIPSNVSYKYSKEKFKGQVENKATVDLWFSPYCKHLYKEDTSSTMDLSISSQYLNTWEERYTNEESLTKH